VFVTSNKPNHQIQNPQLLVTEPRTRDNLVLQSGYGLKFMTIFALVATIRSPTVKVSLRGGSTGINSKHKGSCI
jgi:hypothetical protein